jgi:hypothetical protein
MQEFNSLFNDREKEVIESLWTKSSSAEARMEAGENSQAPCASKRLCPTHTTTINHNAYRKDI